MKKGILALSMVLALVGAMVMPTAALATEDDTVVSGTQANIFTLTVPEGISLGTVPGTLDLGPNPGTVTAGSVVSNTAGWVLDVADAGLVAGSMVVTQAVLADSGTVNTIVDDLLTQGNDYFNGWSIVCLTQATGTLNVGDVKTVLDFASGTDTLTTSADWDEAVVAGDTFTLYKALASALQVGYTVGYGENIAAYQTALQGGSGHGLVTNTYSIPLFVNQPVVNTDAPGAYSLTLTYTATPAN